MCAALLPFCLQTHNPPPRGVPQEALPGLPALYFLLGSAKEGGKMAWGEREWSSDSQLTPCQTTMKQVPLPEAAASDWASLCSHFLPCSGTPFPGPLGSPWPPAAACPRLCHHALAVQPSPPFPVSSPFIKLFSLPCE